MENASQVFPYVVPCPLIWQFRHSGKKYSITQTGSFVRFFNDARSF
jgi:hypothetical protein